MKQFTPTLIGLSFCLFLTTQMAPVQCAFAKKADQKINHMVRRGDHLFSRRAYHAASNIYNQAVALDPENWQLRLKFGKSLSRVGKHQEAIAQLFESLLLNEKHPKENLETRKEIAAVFLKQANYDEAGGQLKQVLEFEPEDVDVRGNYAICLERLGFIELACEEFNLVARSRPNSTIAFYNLGNALFKRQDYKRAALAFKRAIGLSPENYLAIVALAKTHFRMGQTEKALFVFRQALRINPNNHYAYLGLAEVYENLGESRKAVEAYKKAIQINPTDPQSKAALAKLLDNSKRLVEANGLNLTR